MGLLAPSNTQSGGLLARSSPDAFGSAADALPINFGTQTSTPSTNSTPDTLGVLKSIGQATARASAAFGATLAAVPGRIGGLLSGKMPIVPFGQDQFVVPNDNSDLARLEQALVGTKEPISFATQGESVPFVPKGASYAPLVGVTAGLLDLVGEGAAKGLTGLTKSLTEAKDVADASLLLRKAGFADDIVQHAAPVFANLTNAEDVKNGLLSLQDLQNTTVRAGESSRVGARSAGEIIGSKPALTAAKVGDEASQSIPTEPTTPPVGTFTQDAVESALGTKERGFIMSTKENFPELTTRVAGQYIPRSTDTLAVQAKNFIKDDLRAATNLAKTGTDDKAVATAAELIKKWVNDAMTATDAAHREQFYDNAADIANATAKNLTELGRSVQAASILGRMTPGGLVRFAARSIQKYNEEVDAAFAGGRFKAPTVSGLITGAKKIPELSGEQVSTLIERAQTIEKMTDGDEKAMATKQLMNDLHDLVPSPLFKKLSSIWKTGLLTGLRTIGITGLNVVSNLAHGASEIASETAAVPFDVLTSLITGKRTVAATLRGLAPGVQEGLQKGWRYLKTGYDERDLPAHFDLGHVGLGSGKFAKAIEKYYVEPVRRIMGAEDQVFYYGALRHSIASQVIALAKTQGLKGEEYTQFLRETLENPTDEIIRNAVLDAETAVFQNNTVLAKAAAGLKRAVPLLEGVIPFTKTPSSYAMQIINYSPIGAIKETVAQVLNIVGKREFDQRTLVKALGRSTVGTVGGAYIGYKLNQKGLISLSRPKTESEQRQWELEGRIPNSIKIGGKWRGVGILGPIGNEVIAGAYLDQGIKDTGSITKGVLQAAFGAGKSITQQTFLSGLSSVLDAFNSPEQYATSFISSLLGSVVPTAVADTARATDPYERNTVGQLLGGIKSRVPGVREKTLQPKVDTFGEKLQTPGFWTVMLDPTRPVAKEWKNDPVVDELRRLTDAGTPATPTELENGKGYAILTPEQNTALLEQAGTLLHKKLDGLVASPQYQALDDEGKSKIISSFTDQAKTYARAAMVLQLTHGLTGESLKQKLSALKKDGLMSKQVFDSFVKIR